MDMWTGFLATLTPLQESKYQSSIMIIDDKHHISFSGLLECANYEIGAPPFTATLFHDGTDGLTLDWMEVKVHN